MKTRTTILGLMAVVLFAAIGFAALRGATNWWASSIFTMTLTGLAFAALYAEYRRGERRAFWAAFAVFGWGYLVLTFCPGCEIKIRPRLVTTNLLDALLPIVHLGPVPTVRLWDATTGKPVNAGSPVNPVRFSPDSRLIGWGMGTSPARESFQDIGHSLVALLLAGIGGVASRYLHAHRDERRKEAVERAAGVILKVIETGL
jgi:hypothetical protein